MDAESLRDAMLLSSREIDLKLGGPSFRPTISDEALEGLSRKSSAWQASPPEEQLRRSIYMYTKRHLIAPLMTTFDFCDTGQRAPVYPVVPFQEVDGIPKTVSKNAGSQNTCPRLSLPRAFQFERIHLR